MDSFECWAVIYLRPDGTAGNRVEYYGSRAVAVRHVDKSTSIHGSYPNGSPRWRIAHMIEQA